MLVATTVIEVGIDVPNATVMLIENAERFGISQLHQLRGRVGRGEHRCELPAGRSAAAGSGGCARSCAHADGFRLAEIDLELRKEGELIGTRQSGVRAVPRRAPARGRPAAGARARARRGDRRERPRAARARARAAGRRRSSASFGGEQAIEPIPRSTQLTGRYGCAHARDRGTPRRQAPEGAEGQGDAADLRPREGGAVRDARRASRARACSTCSRAPARSASRRSRGAPRGPCSSSATRAW